MPFASAATPFLLSLTFHFGTMVVSLPGYTATFHTRSQPAVVATVCRDIANEIRPRSLACAAALGEVPRPALGGLRTHATKKLAGYVLPLGLPWTPRGDALRASGGYGIPAGASLTLPRQWLSLQEK